MSSQQGGESTAEEDAASVCSDSTYQCSESSVDLSSDTGSECLECDNCEASVEHQGRLESKIMRLISQREQLRGKISRTEDTVLGLETQLLDTKSQLRQLEQEETLLCQGCGQVRDPRHRKQLVLQGFHRDVLRDKPKQLLCIFGLFKRLEAMVDQGLMDFPSVFIETVRCLKCRQVSGCAEAKALLLGDLAEVLAELPREQGTHNTLGCSTESMCGECLAYVERCLNSELPTSGPELPPVENSVPRIPESLRSRCADKQQEQGQAQGTVGLLVGEQGQAQGTVGHSAQKKFKKLKKHLEENSNSNPNIGVPPVKINQFENKMATVNELDNKIELQINEFKLCQEKVTLEAAAPIESVARAPLCLSEFSGEIWEDPNLALLQWKQELRDLGVPESQWCLLVSKFLKGKAMIWVDACIFGVQRASWVTWEDFCHQFRYRFDNRYSLFKYLQHFSRGMNTATVLLTNSQLLQLALRAVEQKYDTIHQILQSPDRRLFRLCSKSKPGDVICGMKAIRHASCTHNACQYILCNLLETIYNSQKIWK